MKRVWNISFVLMFIVFGALAFSPPPKANFLVGNPVIEESAESPKTLYIRNCARCHGADGKSQTELGQTLDAADLTVDKTSVKRNLRVITNGAGAMPAFGKKLRKAEISALANYVRSL